MPVSNERSGRRRRLWYVADGGPCSVRKVITLGYEDSGYNVVMKGLCYCATGGCTQPLYNVQSESHLSHSSDV
jgi:hypothetical protein